MTARLLSCSVDEYHKLPHFSSSRAKVLLERSPRHARAMVDKSPTKAMERGDVVHRLVLGRGKMFKVVEHGDWRTKAAQGERDKARADGLVPILSEDFEDACTLAEYIRVWLADHDILLDGASEQAIEWTEHTEHGDVLCKGMLDHLWLHRGRVLDLKVTADASLSAVERTAENLWYGVQEAAYTSGLTKIAPEHAGRVEFLFCFAEVGEPGEVKLVRGDGMFRELGEQRWRRAVTKWAKCAADEHWPGYEYTHFSAPMWALRQEGFSADE